MDSAVKRGIDRSEVGKMIVEKHLEKNKENHCKIKVLQTAAMLFLMQKIVSAYSFLN